MIINYLQRWGTDGAHYTQTIKIDKVVAEKFNNYLLKLKSEIDNNFFKNHYYSENDLKIKSLDYLWDGVNFTNLIHLELFINFYLKEIYQPPKKDKNFERILHRNTIIEVI